MLIGNRIKKLRELRGYSQEYMAKKLGVSQEQYSYIESKQKSISEEQKKKIASLLEVSMEYLEQFNPLVLIQNSQLAHSNNSLNLEQIIIQSHENERRSYLELIERLKEEIEELKAKSNQKL